MTFPNMKSLGYFLPDVLLAMASLESADWSLDIRVGDVTADVVASPAAAAAWVVDVADDVTPTLVDGLWGTLFAPAELCDTKLTD